MPYIDSTYYRKETRGSSITESEASGSPAQYHSQSPLQHNARARMHQQQQAYPLEMITRGSKNPIWRPGGAVKKSDNFLAGPNVYF